MKKIVIVSKKERQGRFNRMKKIVNSTCGGSGGSSGCSSCTYK